MKKIVIGEKFTDIKFDFRETCFGICERDGQILLTHKVNKNEIAMVGGGVEKGESHKDCLCREFMEESGYTVLEIKELCSVDCFWLAGGKWPMESLANFYVVKLSESATQPTEKGHEPMWVRVEDAEKLLPLPYQKEGIRQYLSYCD